MTYKILLLAVTAIVFVCCKNENSQYMNERLKDVTEQYQQNLKSFGFSGQLTNHFPKTIKSLPLKLYPNLDSTKGFVSVILFEFNVDKNRIDSLKNKLQERKVTLSDSNLLVIGSNSSVYDENKIPIPYFERQDFSHKENTLSSNDVYSNNTEHGLTREFEFYTLEYQSGKYWNGLNQEKPEILKFQDGYAKGISINLKKQILVYWTLIW